MIKPLYIPITFFFFPLFLYSQTDQQLRDPEYLVDQYNQLVSKHNALIEKTRVLISEKVQPTQYVDNTDAGLQNKLNEAHKKYRC